MCFIMYYVQMYCHHVYMYALLTSPKKKTNIDIPSVKCTDMKC